MMAKPLPALSTWGCQRRSSPYVALVVASSADLTSLPMVPLRFFFNAANDICIVSVCFCCMFLYSAD